MPTTTLRSLSLLATALAAALASACGGAAPGEEDLLDNDDLTSLTAVEKALSFDSYVDLPASTADAQIDQAVHASLRAAFGAFRTAGVGLNDRELRHNLDPSKYVKTALTLASGASQTRYVRVRYHYTDRAVVAKGDASRTTMKIATLAPDYQTNRIAELLDTDGCSDGGHEAAEFRDAAWYIFNPNTSRCLQANAAEQKAIDAERTALTLAAGQIGPKEARRLFFPALVKLDPVAGAPLKYPEYDRLLGLTLASKSKLIVQGINGQLADWADPNAVKGLDDEGYTEFLKQLRIILAARPELKTTSVSGGTDLFHYTVEGKQVTAGWSDLFKWNLDGAGFPSGFSSYAQQRALLQAVYDKVFQKQIVFQAPMVVKSGATSKKITVEVRMYYGDDGSSSEPFRAAFKEADVFVYNGHSYIGHGPMDPGNFRASDFKKGYQILVFDSCVSFNYYEKGFIDLKSGTRNLDLITNGLASATSDSGGSMGRLVAALIDGKGNSYPQVLKAAQFAEGWGSYTGDALRVVDGELDNPWTPQKRPFTLTAQ